MRKSPLMFFRSTCHYCRRLRRLYLFGLSTPQRLPPLSLTLTLSRRGPSTFLGLCIEHRGEHRSNLQLLVVASYAHVYTHIHIHGTRAEDMSDVWLFECTVVYPLRLCCVCRASEGVYSRLNFAEGQRSLAGPPPRA